MSLKENMNIDNLKLRLVIFLVVIELVGIILLAVALGCEIAYRAEIYNIAITTASLFWLVATFFTRKVFPGVVNNDKI